MYTYLHNRTNVSVFQFSIGNGSDYFADIPREIKSLHLCAKLLLSLFADFGYFFDESGVFFEI